MTKVMRILAVLALLAVAASGGGCGGGGTDRTKTQLRLVNASAGYEQLDLRTDQVVRQGGVVYGESAAYATVDPNFDDLTVHATGSPTTLLSSRPSLARDKHYTLLAYGNAGALQQQLLDDEQGAPETGRTTLRVVNAAPDAGTLDVYLTASAEALDASVPFQAGAQVGALGAWQTVPSGTWRLRVAAAGSKTDLRLDLATLVLASRDVLTLVLTPSRGGVLVNALVLVQQGAVTRADGAQARVRLVNGVSGLAAPLAMTIDFLPLADGVAAGTASAYASTDASVVARIAVTGASALLFLGIDQRLDAAAVYSVFVVGAQDAATGILRKDR